MVDPRHPPLPPGVPRPPMGNPPMGNPPMGSPPMGSPPPPPSTGYMPIPPRPPQGMPVHAKMPPHMKMPPHTKMPPHMKMPAPPMGAPPMGIPLSKTPHPYAIEEEDEDFLADFDENVTEEGDLELEDLEVEESLPLEEESVVSEESDDFSKKPSARSVSKKREKDSKRGDFGTESHLYADNFASDLGLPPLFIKTKGVIGLFVLFLCIGIGGGMFLGNPRQVVSEELPGVVTNPEIPKGRPRCGLAQKGQGCVLYVMNAQRREMQAKEFFGIASDMVGIPKFQVETSNIRYATVSIPPGYIGLFNIPPVQ